MAPPAGGRPISVSIRGVAETLATFDTVELAYTITDTWVVGTNVEYAAFVEFGTSRMAAQPYLRPAAEAVVRNHAHYFASAATANDAIAQMALEMEREAKTRCPVDTGRLRASIRAEKIR